MKTQPSGIGGHISAAYEQQILDAAIHVLPNALTKPNKFHPFHIAGKIARFFLSNFNILF
jgi:hypothetical protein